MTFFIPQTLQTQVLVEASVLSSDAGVGTELTLAAVVVDDVVKLDRLARGSASSSVIFAEDFKNPVQYSVCFMSCNSSETEAVEGFDDDRNSNR
jgi:hypothetical protein